MKKLNAYLWSNLLLLGVFACTSRTEQAADSPQTDTITAAPVTQTPVDSSAQEVSAAPCHAFLEDSLKGGFRLFDAESTVKTLGDMEEQHFYDTEPLDTFTRFINVSALYFVNKDKSSYMRLILPPRPVVNEFMFLEVGKTKKVKTWHPLKTTRMKSFESAKGIRLGMSKATLYKIIGRTYTKETPLDRQTIRVDYTFSQQECNHPKLLMSLYIAYFVFRNNQLIYYGFGYDYERRTDDIIELTP